MLKAFHQFGLNSRVLPEPCPARTFSPAAAGDSGEDAADGKQRSLSSPGDGGSEPSTPRDAVVSMARDAPCRSPEGGNDNPENDTSRMTRASSPGSCLRPSTPGGIYCGACPPPHRLAGSPSGGRPALQANGSSSPSSSSVPRGQASPLTSPAQLAWGEANSATPSSTTATISYHSLRVCHTELKLADGSPPPRPPQQLAPLYCASPSQRSPRVSGGCPTGGASCDGDPALPAHRRTCSGLSGTRQAPSYRHTCSGQDSHAGAEECATLILRQRSGSASMSSSPTCGSCDARTEGDPALELRDRATPSSDLAATAPRSWEGVGGCGQRKQLLKPPRPPSAALPPSTSSTSGSLRKGPYSEIKSQKTSSTSWRGVAGRSLLWRSSSSRGPGSQDRVTRLSQEDEGGVRYLVSVDAEDLLLGLVDRSGGGSYDLNSLEGMRGLMD